MEKPLYPSSNMRITQGYEEGTHKDSYAIDDAGKDTGISYLKAPFTGTIKKIYEPDANEVWLESSDKVLYPDGTEDYMTIMFCHSNDVSNLFIGKLIKKGEEFYSEGTKGNATGNHCHIECAKGKFSPPGWHKNKNGYYSIDNGKKPEECLWIDDSINIINSHGYQFKKITNNTNKTDDNTNNNDKVEPSPSVPQKEPMFVCKKAGLYGIYLKENQKVYLD